MSKITQRTIMRTDRHVSVRLILRQLLPLIVVAIAIWLLKDRFGDTDFNVIRETVAQVTIGQWLAAIAATCASFWAVGRYDAVLHGVLATDLPAKTARQSGAAAIAIAQFAGFGALTGALVRWRLLRHVSFWQATRISLAVSASFLAGWAVVTAFVLVFTGFASPILQTGAIVTLVIFCTLLGLSLWQPRVLPALPSMRAMLAVVVLATLDTVFAGVALWVLLPVELNIPITTLLPVFLLALGAGLLGGTPGGVGPFELTLLTLLPMVPGEPLLAAALAFRLVYYVLPAGLAVIVLFRGARTGQPVDRLSISPVSGPYLRQADEAAIWAADHAEVNLVRQGRFGMLHTTGTAIAAVAKTGQSLVMLSAPFTGDHVPAKCLHFLSEAAAKCHRTPVLYKCQPRLAASARTIGWPVIPVARLAWLDPAGFTLNGSRHRQLRRLIRKAETAGVTVTQGAHKLPLDQMQVIADNWARARGGERGFSMGVFDPDYVQCQRVFLASRGGELVAFLTLNEVAGEWGLDLMRQSADAPDGTMHLLLAQAIERAKTAGCPRVSLAATSHPGDSDSALVSKLRNHLNRVSGADGLRRFKASFAPEWQTLYATAPTRSSLIIGLWDILRAINRDTGRRYKPGA